ncbi:MAG: SIMPL domain-containing protein [Rhizobiales bacterium]|nr:SIMPL domain-containing protein [Hyphomicrobiales bacterium]
MRSVFSALLVLILAGSAATAQPAPRGEPMITVHGEGQVQVPPDQAKLTVAITTKAQNLEAATATHRDRAERGAKALEGLKGDGLVIKQSTFALNEIRVPVRPNAPQGPDKPEYQATTTFELQLDKLDAIDRVVTAVAATGLFEVHNIRFAIGDRNPGLNDARRKAVENARSRASIYAKAAGVELGDVLRIDEGGSAGPREFAMAAPMARSVKVMPPETLTLTASVTMTWRIKP